MRNVKLLRIGIVIVAVLLSFSKLFSQQQEDLANPSYSTMMRILNSDTTLKVKLKVQIQLTSYFQFRNGDSANYYADLALKNASKVGLDDFSAHAENNKSMLLLNQLRYSEALEHALAALKLYEKLEMRKEANQTEDNIGNIFYSLKKYDDAKVYFVRALENRITLGDSLGIAVSHLNLGSLYSKAGKYTEAIEEQRMCLQMAEALGHDRLIAIASNNLSLALMELGRYEEAEQYLQRSIAICLRTQNKSSLKSAFQKLAENFRYRKALDSAISYYHKSIQIGDEMHDFIGHRIAYEALSEIYELKGEYSKSIQYLRLVQEISDSSFSDEVEENVAKYQVQYETDRLNREKLLALAEKKEIATALKFQQSETEIANLKLSRNSYIIAGLLLCLALIVVLFVVLQMRSKLKNQVKILELKQSILQSQMNPHFIFNALNSIQNQILNRDRKDAYAYHSKFSELMRSVLEASNRETISLEEEVSAISNYLDLEQLRTDDKFDFTVTVDPNLDLRTTMVPPLLIQPFAENSVWHGLMNKAGHGHIQIDISASPTGIHYAIVDNGIGRKRAGEFNALQSRNHASRGVQVTNERVRYFNLAYGRQLEMQITDLTDAQGQASGTRVEIEIPYL